MRTKSILKSSFRKSVMSRPAGQSYRLRTKETGLTTLHTSTQRLRQPGFAQRSSFGTSSVTPVNHWPTSRKSQRLIRFKRDLRRISGSNAALSWLVTILSLSVISLSGAEHSAMWDQSVLLTAGVCLASLLQVSLIISYWTVRLRYLDQVRAMLQTNEMPIIRLCKSGKSMICCVCECAFHLVVLFPKFGFSASVNLLGMRSELATYDLIFLTILLRNYHSVEYWYWSVEFSGVRARFYADLLSVPAQLKFVAKSCLRRYGARMMLLTYSGGVAILSSSLYALAYRVEGQFAESLQDAVFAVVMSVSRTNHQEKVAFHLVGYWVVLASAVLGCLLLGVAISALQHKCKLTHLEAELCTTMMGTTIRERHRKGAAVLIQRWWRFLRIRKGNCKDSQAVADEYHSQLCNYKAILVHSRNERSECLRWRLKDIETRTSKVVKHITGFSNILTASNAKVSPTQLLQITRLEYRFFVQCSQISKFTGAPKPTAPQRHGKPHMKKRYRRLSTISEEDFEVGSRSPSPKRASSGNPFEVKCFLAVREEPQLELEGN